MTTFKPGDFVKINEQETVAEILAIKGNTLELSVGSMKMTVKKSNVSPVKTPKPQTPQNPISDNLPSSAIRSIDIKEKLHHFQFELDVRGKPKEEIITDLNAWVDDAILLGIPEAKVVHGRGTGTLKELVRSFLRKYKEIEKVGDDASDFVTLVKFRS